MGRARINHTAGDRPILLFLMSILTFMAYTLEPQQPASGSWLTRRLFDYSALSFRVISFQSLPVVHCCFS